MVLMSISIADKLTSLGHKMPEAAAPVANYVSTVRAGDLLFISGQINAGVPASPVPARVGADPDIEQARRAAQAAALGVLAQISAATNGQVSAVRRIVRLGVFIASSPQFKQHPEVANGASDLIAAVFAEAGRHARTAVGVASLPRGAMVEVDAIIELED
jgi:enamine deaminase RidA (YjgF/YER057c/UK114 family)